MRPNNWIHSGQLYLPGSVLPSKSPKHYLPVLEAITAENILGYRGTEKRAKEICKDLYWRDCIIFASRINTLLEKYGMDNIDLQIELCQKLFSIPLKNRIIKKLNNPINNTSFSLFNFWQILVFIKFILLYGSEDESKGLSISKNLESIGNCLLIINDLVGLGSSKTDTNDADYLNESLIRNSAFFHREYVGNLFPRYYDLFLELPTDHVCRHSPNYIDIGKVFHQMAGFDLNLFFALGLGIYSFYFANDDLSIKKYVLNSDKFFVNTIVNSDDAAKLFDLIAITREQYKEKHKKKYGENNFGNYFDFTLLRKYPLIKVEDRIYVPTDLRFLSERVTSGLYWDIFDYLTGKEKIKYATFFGELLQKYVELRFKRIYPQSETSVNRICFDIEYEGGRSSDVILFYSDEAIFIEVTVGRIRMDDTAIPGDLNSFKEDVNRKIVDSARQIDRVINDFVSGKLDIPDISPSDMTMFYPIIVTLSPLPIFISTYDEVRTLIAEAGYLESSKISGIEFISLGELEILEYLLEHGYTFIEILKDKLSNKFYRIIPLWHYLYLKYKKELLKYNDNYRKNRIREIFNEIKPLLFSIDNKSPSN